MVSAVSVFVAVSASRLSKQGFDWDLWHHWDLRPDRLQDAITPAGASAR